MIRISLTDFVEIVSKSGTPKFTKVRQVKERPVYEPAFDFYKSLREFIIETHRSNGTKKTLDDFINEISDEKKLRSFRLVISGYKKWWGSKRFKWFTPPRASYKAHGVEIAINPEIGLEFNGRRHVIKLHFKSAKLSKRKTDIITQLMELKLRNSCKRAEIMGVLDIRNSKLLSYDGRGTVKAMIDGELSYISTIWQSL